MSEQHAEDLANVTADLTAVHNARARVRIDAAERDADTVGSALAAYRARAGLTEQGLADWLGINLLTLAALTEELRPGTDEQTLGLDALADLYDADRARLLEAFKQGDP